MSDHPAKKPEKYVVILAHADGWGALSANKIIKHLHENYPDLGIHLIVSQATKNPTTGRIVTGLDDLRPVRELKETNLLQYFEQIDKKYDETPSMEKIIEEFPHGVGDGEGIDKIMDLAKRHTEQSEVQFLTFKQLAKRYCAEATVHYTTRGGKEGGVELQGIVENLEQQYGHGPEVMLSVDTMAFVTKALHDKYRCFSTHPGPLDSIRIEGMQGTLRSLVNQVLYDAQGNPLPENHVFGMGLAHVKGTLFLQREKLDEGPPDEIVLAPVVPGMSAYQVRDEVYNQLVDGMIGRLPIYLNAEKREARIRVITAEKVALDAAPHIAIGALEKIPFATWQGMATAFPSEDGIEVLQNQIVDPRYFRNIMRRFYPGGDEDFNKSYDPIFGNTVERIVAQKRERLTDPWTILAMNNQEHTLCSREGPNEPVKIFNNRIPILDPYHPMNENNLEGIAAFSLALVDHLGGPEAVLHESRESLQRKIHMVIEKEKPPALMAIAREHFGERWENISPRPSSDHQYDGSTR
jgi:hypothetical protein